MLRKCSFLIDGCRREIRDGLSTKCRKLLPYRKIQTIQNYVFDFLDTKDSFYKAAKIFFKRFLHKFLSQ
jgi:hypothetical protein